MEEGEGEGLERFEVVDESEKKKAAIPPAPPLPAGAIPPPVSEVSQLQPVDLEESKSSV